MSIRRLPDDVVTKIRSSATITSLNGVILGLLKNSLDAGASRINVYLDYGRGNCTVEDDGRGIVPSEFAEGGGLGRPNFTSKYPHHSGTHGRKGAFLASVAALSLISIASHHHRFNSHNAISIHHGRVLTRQRPACGSDRLETFDHGTRVAVHDLFGSMPVRVKHRATLFSDRSGIEKEWMHLTHDIVALLLAWPLGVSISLKETKTQAELRLKSGDTTDLVSRTRRLFSQALLANTSDPEAWIPVSASRGHVSIKGCISLDPVATRRSQFISFGILPILDEFGSNVLYEGANKVFKNSSFGVVEGDAVDAQVTNLNEVRAKLRKGVDRWPTFCFRVSLSGSEVAIDADQGPAFRQRDLQDIISLLRDLCYGFLKKYHFRPQKIADLPRESPLSTEAWARVPTQAAPKQQAAYPDDKEATSAISSTAFHPPSGSHLIDLTLTKPGFPLSSRHDVWQGEATAIRGDRETHRPGTMSARFSHLDSRTSEKSKEPHERPEPSEWLRRVLDSWENPVFETAEPLLPQLQIQSGAFPGETDTRPAQHQCHGGDTGGINFEVGTMSLHGRVSREALGVADVISQIDRKYILVKLPLRSVNSEKTSSALIVLDQHAADERRRLETLMAGYFTEDPRTGTPRAITEGLGKPIWFEVSDQEGVLLQRYKDHFGHWGVIYSVQPRTRSRFERKEDSCKVMVTALPPSILERCRGEPRLLVELARREIWRLHDGGITPAQPEPQTRTSTSYMPERVTANFHNCPRGILELLHSRSCRSAIMFNDALTKEECEGLVRGLAKCALPFQCAHGRPSMVPLVDLGSDGGMRGLDGGGTREDTKGALVRWKSWMEGG